MTGLAVEGEINDRGLQKRILLTGIEKLGTRRVKICLRFAESTATRSRRKDIFKPATTNPARTGKTTLKYWELLARTATYYKSAVPYLTRLLKSH